MPEERNQNQIIRIDARNCFVESLNDSFGFGKAHSRLRPMISVNRAASARRTAFRSILISLSCWSYVGNWSAVSCGT